MPRPRGTRSPQEELREAFAPAIEGIASVFKNALKKSLHAAADAALEEVQGGVERVGENIGRVRRKARRRIEEE